MTGYLVKVGFWLRAYDSVTIEAGTAGEAIDKAKAAARILMQSRACPEAIDTDERRQGLIAYIDRVASGCHEPLIEDLAFDDDRLQAAS